MSNEIESCLSYTVYLLDFNILISASEISKIFGIQKLSPKAISI